MSDPQSSENNTVKFAVEFKSVSRIYSIAGPEGGIVQLFANDQLSFSIQEGSIHGLIGENGAGKSTAMKMLFGLESPDAGQIFVFGKAINFNSATDAMSTGIAMVHQHFMLSENETALENFMLMQKNNKPFSWRNIKHEMTEAKNLSQQFGFDIPWEKFVRDLSVGEQQRLEILKALSRKGKILILDEPTAVLTPHETQELFKKLRELRNQGYTIILITHKLKEVLEITDHITVMRRGKVTATLPTAGASVSILAEKMVGSHNHNMMSASQWHRKTISSDSATQERNSPDAKQTSAAKKTNSPDAEQRLFLNQISVAHDGGQLDINNLSVSSGEVVGIAGVEGNGQKELIELLLHPKKFKKISGQIKILGVDTKNFSSRQIRQLSIGSFPEDRLRFGAVLNFNLIENFVLGYQRKLFSDSMLFPWTKAREICAEQIKKFKVTPENPNTEFGRLSGGNQQKLVAARELFMHPKLLIIAQPTRGVDVGATDFIHQQIFEARNSGAAILLISSELDELLKLSDRILVMYQGRIQAEFSRNQSSQTAQFDEAQIGAAMGGIS